MNRFFRHPATNAVGLSVFTSFYSVVFLAFPDRIQSQIGMATRPFWQSWDTFLSFGSHRYIAFILIALTAFIVAFLFIKHKPYDEYHTAILIKCLAISVIITLAAIAVFFVVVLIDPAGIIGKFTLFIAVNWSTVVLADLTYLLICGRK